MNELLHAAVAPPNLLPTGLLVFVLLYWLTVILGLIDFKSLDLEVAVDADSDLELGPDTTDGHLGHHAGEAGVSFLNHALAFFNLGRVPLMVFVSLRGPAVVGRQHPGQLLPPQRNAVAGCGAAGTAAAG